MPAEIGLAGFKLQDGICIADRIVRAPVEDVIAIFGTPQLIARDGVTLVDAPPEGITMFAASNGEWSIVEPPDSLMMSEEDDYLMPLFEQGIAALQGQIPANLPAVYENPLPTASMLAKTLGVEAIALWGSDEWVGICGGAVLDASGDVSLAYSACSVEEMGRCAASRLRMLADEEEEGDLDDIIDDDARKIAYVFEAGGVERALPGGDAMDLLDMMLKDRNAAQPFDPVTLWGMWPAEGDVWVALG